MTAATTQPSYAKLFDELKRYLRFSERDAELLAAFCPHAKPHFERIVGSFYERAREHEGAHAVFESNDQIARLHRSLILWLERVLSGPYDATYCAASARIGMMHVRVGLPQRYMFTAMSLFRMELARIADGAAPAVAADTRDALNRVLDIELALMSETYRDAQLARLERLRNAKEPSRRLYRAAVELAGAMIVVLDASATIQLFNREAERITGYGYDEVVGESFPQLLLVDAQECAFDVIWKTARTTSGPKATSLSIECLLRTRSGKQRLIRGTLSHASVESDDEWRAFLVGRDVTEEDVLTERLRRTEKLASVGALAAGLAHEIRNPLNGAQLHLTLLRRSLRKNGGDGDGLEAIDVVEGEVRRLSQLVTDFLDFARPRNLQCRPTSIQDLCRHCVDLVRGKAAAVDVSLELKLPDQEASAEVDGARVEQVLLNLLDNAIAAAPNDSGVVVLSVYREPHAVVIEVSDNGPGLADADAAIFEAFYSTKTDGTGLGLAITQRIVNDHGGELSVSSTPGDTRFVVKLPLAQPAPSSHTHLQQRSAEMVGGV